jgi:hypothetical protein
MRTAWRSSGGPHVILLQRAASLSPRLFFLEVQEGKSGPDVPRNTIYESRSPPRPQLEWGPCSMPIIGIEPMPPQERVWRPLRLKMKGWSQKR